MEVYFVHEDVEKFMESLDETNRSKAVRMIETLERYGYAIGMPYSKHRRVFLLAEQRRRLLENT